MLWWCSAIIYFFNPELYLSAKEGSAIKHRGVGYPSLVPRVCVWVWVSEWESLAYVPENATQGGWDGTGVNERVTKKASEHGITECE